MRCFRIRQIALAYTAIERPVCGVYIVELDCIGLERYTKITLR